MVKRIQTIQGDSGANYQNSLSFAAGQAVIAGNYLFLAITTSHGVASITDSLGNTWTKIDDKQASSNAHLDLWECKSALAGTPTITIQLGSGNFDTIVAVGGEYNPVYRLTPRDQSNFNIESGFNSSRVTNATPTTTQANEMAIAVYGYSNADVTLTETSGGWSSVVNRSNHTQFTGIAMVDRSLSAEGTPEATFDSGGSFLNGVAYIITLFQAPQPVPRGVALSGLEFSPNSLPGTLGSSYFTSSQNTKNYFAGKGANIVRLPILWERMQPTLGGPLDPTYKAIVDGEIAGNLAAGMRTIIDLHNYGRRIVVPTSGGITDNFTGSISQLNYPYADYSSSGNIVLRDFGEAFLGTLLNPILPATGYKTTFNLKFNSKDTSFGGEGLYTRLMRTDANNYYEFGADYADGTWVLAKIINGVRTVLATSPFAWVIGTTYAISIDVNQATNGKINISINGTPIFTANSINSDPLLSKGQVSFFPLGVHAQLDTLVLNINGDTTSGNSGQFRVGDAQVSTAQFADFWGKMASAYAGNIGVYAYDLMNEPHDMPVPTTPSNYKTTSSVFLMYQAAITAIEAVDKGHFIICEIDPWAGGQNFVSSYGATPDKNIGLGSSDSLIIISFHYYFDDDHSGTYPIAFKSSNNSNISSDLSGIMSWSQSSGSKLFCGEYGVPNISSWQVCLTTFFQILNANNVWAVQWAAGDSYTAVTSMQPTGTFPSVTDALQAAIVFDQKNLGMLVPPITTNKSFTVDGIIKAKNTLMFTVDGIIKGKVTSLKQFTIDGVIIEDTTTPSVNDLILETMQVAPIGTLKDNATYITASPSYVRFTQAVNGQDGQLDYTQTLPSSFSIIANLWQGGGSGADANYIYWGQASAPTGEDAPGGYIVAIDEYNGDDFPIQLQYNGTRLASSAYPYQIDNQTIRKVQVVVDGLRIIVYVNNVKLIDFTDVSRSLPGNHVGVGARTGGVNDEHRCYFLRVFEIASPYHPTPIAGGLSALKYRSLDIMKLTKDTTVNSQLTRAQKVAAVQALATNLNLTHIAIAVPLDTDGDYIPTGIVPAPNTIVSEVQQWVDTIHNFGLGVMFRGDFNEFERDGGTGNWNFVMAVGVNRTPRGTAASAPTDGRTTILGKLYKLITNNPNWYKDGDIWAPMPERTENNTIVLGITSLTRVGTTATIVFPSPHGLGNGQPVLVGGADQAAYNGSFIITVIDAVTISYQVAGSPATPATGADITVTFGDSLFADGTAFLGNDGGGVNDNYNQFFQDVKTSADVAFASINKNVKTGFTSNNYTEINSGFIEQGLFDALGRVAIDNYGLTHTPTEMYNQLVGVFLAKGHILDWEEWSDYWNGALSDQDRTDYLVDWYNMVVQLMNEGVIEMLNYWGGWVFGTGEGILVDTSGGLGLSYTISNAGKVLQSYLAAPLPPTIVTPSGTQYGYFLNGVLLKTPSAFQRQYVYAKNDYITLTGKTVRDVSTIKQKHIMKFMNLTVTQSNAIETIIRLEKSVSFIVNGKDQVNINTTVWPFSASIVYDKPGAEYRSTVTLECMEVGG